MKIKRVINKSEKKNKPNLNLNLKNVLKFLATVTSIACLSSIINQCSSTNKPVNVPNNSITLAKDSTTPNRNVSIYDASQFVSLSDYIPDVILEMRYFSTYNFTGKRVPGYDEPIALLNEKAAKALKKVSDEVNKKGYRLKIWDAYRPQTAVTYFMEWCNNEKDTLMKDYFYPNLTKEEILDGGYLWSESKHCKGGTVDLTLFDKKTGKEVDMGSPFDFFGEISNYDHKENLTEEQKANRKLLRDVMEKNGFTGIESEWWHFNFKNIEGDPYLKTSFDFSVKSKNARNKNAERAEDSESAKIVSEPQK